MLSATMLSLGVVFLAELGDRSQLITMTYALRYRWWVVLTGVAIASVTVHGVSVAVGHFLGTTVPARPMAFVGAIAFLIFAGWAWREGREDPAGADEVAHLPNPRFALLTVVSSFVLAELSDKTTLATVTLASDHNWAGVWIGTTLGMIVADGLAIGVGLLLHHRLPEQLLHLLASLLFLLFGLWMLFEGALGWRSVRRCRSRGANSPAAPQRRRTRHEFTLGPVANTNRHRPGSDHPDHRPRHRRTGPPPAPVPCCHPPSLHRQQSAQSDVRHWRLVAQNRARSADGEHLCSLPAPVRVDLRSHPDAVFCG